MIKYIFALIAHVTIQTAFAQSYDLAAGVRLGSDVGVSVKMRAPLIDENFTGEFIVQSSLERAEGQVALIGAQHLPLITRRLNLYTGIGAHVGWLENDPDRAVDYKAPVGVSFIGGAEVNFKRFSISLDYRPVLNLSGGEKTFYSTSAFTLRYIAVKRYGIFTSPREKRKRQRVKKRRHKAEDRDAKGKKGWQFWKKG